MSQLGSTSGVFYARWVRFWVFINSRGGSIGIKHGLSMKHWKSILQVPDTGTRVLDNTRPFLRSSIVSFRITPAHSKERKYYIFRQYWYTKNVPVFTNTMYWDVRSSIWDLKYTFSEAFFHKSYKNTHRPPRFESIYFRSDPIKGQRSSRGQSAFQMPYGYQIWSEEPLRTDQSVVHCWGQRSQLGSTTGQFA